jgi:hypothetical protein
LRGGNGSKKIIDNSTHYKFSVIENGAAEGEGRRKKKGGKFSLALQISTSRKLNA